MGASPNYYFEPIKPQKMRARIEIEVESLLRGASQITLRTAEAQGRLALEGVKRRYITHRDRNWVDNQALEADAKVRSTISATLIDEGDMPSDTTLRYCIECRDKKHGEEVAQKIELTLERLIAISWWRLTGQNQLWYEAEILTTLKSVSHLNKRVRRKYSLY